MRKTDCQYEAAVQESTAQASKRKYQELQSAKTAHERVYDALKLRSDADAQAILKRIRKGDDIETIVRHVDFGDLLLPVALTPEARFRYVFPFCEDMPPYLI